MARRITNITKDGAILNSELRRLDTHQAQISNLTSRLTLLEKHTSQIRDARQVIAINNLIFTWTGPSLTLSWGVGYVQDSSLKNWPVVAGSRVLSASTVYWLAWNPIQQQMVASADLQTLFSPALNLTPNSPTGNNLIICSVKTGTAGQTGTAGGGGSDSGGTGPCGKQYLDF